MADEVWAYDGAGVIYDEVGLTYDGVPAPTLVQTNFGRYRRKRLPTSVARKLDVEAVALWLLREKTLAD